MSAAFPGDAAFKTAAVPAVVLEEAERPALVAATKGAVLLARAFLPREVGNAPVAAVRRRRLAVTAAEAGEASDQKIAIRLVDVDVGRAIDGKIVDERGIESRKLIDWNDAVSWITYQGQLWGARAQDWATYTEQACLPLFGAALDAARVTSGTRLLDAGCGAGLLALLASLRGAEVTAFDASPGLLAIARQRLPAADVREGDLEALPFADASFDAVTAVNSIFFAEDMAAAVRELVRVVRPGGRVVVTAWGPPERCEFLSAVMPALRPLLPPPPPGASPPHPGALSEPGALVAVLRRAGLRVVDEGEVACPFVFPSTEASWRGNSSAGVNQAAIAHSGEAAVRAVYANADRAHMRPDGSVRYENVFLWVAGERT